MTVPLFLPCVPVTALVMGFPRDEKVFSFLKPVCIILGLHTALLDLAMQRVGGRGGLHAQAVAIGRLKCASPPRQCQPLGGRVEPLCILDEPLQ